LRQELMAPAPLLIDEFHRVAGHHRIQRELLTVLKDRHTAGLTVVMASRWHPNDIWNLDPKLRSYLLSGFVTAIDSPGPQARLRYLRALEGSRSRNGRAVEIEALARSVRGGFHDLRSAWAEQRADSAGSRPAFELINPRAVFERVLQRSSSAFGVEEEDLIGPGQGRRLSLARQVLSYVCVQEGLSRAEVGRYLGGRSRAAISYATKRVKHLMADDGELRARVEELL